MIKILLVEDDQRITVPLTEFLSKEGFTIDCAQGQNEALDKARCASYDLVLLDICLSQGNGFAVCSQIKASNHNDVTNEFFNLAAQLEIDDINVYDLAENARTIRAVIMIIRVFSYGFIALISLIAAANVFNTISTGINLRRREFAMLKSVGMDKKGFNKMMCYESLLYGFKSLLFGLPVSCVMAYLMYMLSVGTGHEIPFTLPWSSIAIAVISVFAVVFSSMIYSMRKIKKENTVDALKNENI